MAQVTNSDIFKVLEKWAPKSLAYDWDNIGLQVGSHNKSVKKIMITLDVLESVVDEAINKNVNLIIAHHPLLFKPLKQLNLDSWQGRIIQKLIQHDITVYAAHTNLDMAPGGVNDMLADMLGLEKKEVLVDSDPESLYKFAVYVPETHVENITVALAKEDAGHIGNYSHCTFQSKGTGTFMPLPEANPFIGNENTLEKVNEVKIETIVKESILSNVLKSVIEAHPYEEVAYDIFPLKNVDDKIGLGRVGSLNQAMSLEYFVEHVKKTLGLSHVRVSGDLSKKVKKVAVLGGSGEKYFRSAIHKKADVYITGDMSFHFAQEAIEMGISVIDAGHYIEQVMKTGTKDYLDYHIQNGTIEDSGIEVIVSEINTDPFQYR